MRKLFAKQTVFIHNLNGATAIEYGLIAGGISLVIVAAIFALGGDLGSVFGVAVTAMQQVNTNAANAGA